MAKNQASAAKLPDAFASLEALVGEWAHATQHARREKRATSTLADLRSYYGRVGPLVPVIARHLDEFSVSAPLPEPQRQLFMLAQMYMEVAWSVEFLKAPEEPDQVPRDRWRITEIA